ncbi:hypothetical protein CB0940_12135 [Cercospora beticola]|uniref:Uncharacterized protein n=1 Tax=Cercospora beticola TaxID=122368 RepID=A0A2G5GID6_CERBT|nr:hypothetical protein CB0940_12135 [Cercospora beticola]PIA80046.1 hypothetical protein CB0940_12135 [Cercospora beticola]WPB07632.1 hypothetical protein RHO25_012293 [Cercospora beticola]CAK1356566.1 unnamed protein product [Cercospora beticola]
MSNFEFEPDTDGEIHRPAYPARSEPYPYISYNIPFHKTISKHLSSSSPSSPFTGKSRVYIIASASLSKNTSHIRTLLDELGDRVVGVRYGMRPHTLWSEILEVTNDAREKKTDVLVTVGAGSLTDGAKIIALALANNASTFSDLENLHSGKDWSKKRPDLNEPTVPIISVPTSLSGGEYSFLGGGTHDTSQTKFGFGHPTKGPALVILDAKLTTTTPEHIWLQSGVRAVDHCVEGLCSLSEKVSTESDESATRGLKLLVKGLLKCKADPQDLVARHECQMGVIDAMGVVFQFGVPMGASHGIGHQLGPMGVGHGETSCVLLPAVCRFNSPVNGERQEKVKEIFWQDEEARKLFEEKALKEEEADLGTLLGCFISALGMPRSLKDVGVEGEEKLEMLATNALTDHWCETNPRPLKTEEDVRAILEMVKS